MQSIKDIIQESIAAKNELFSQADMLEKISNVISEALMRGNKILIFGNGGSAADSQHIAAELVGRYKLERKGLPAIALTTDSSILTAVSNDYDYNRVFSRQVEALASPSDILLGISTSGNSQNVLNAFARGKEIGTVNISLTGRDGGKLKAMSDYNINCPAKETARIQECHMTAYHIICELVEREALK
ncbi:putative phosphoheptose isomerase [archaeon GW2011_AR15]|nr:putative phosphoheptose isomerase [archaeon GW2011_AR15]MBS3103579.1 D-sedoheptulose 7-phosphate isomerase [Candidatus Woesearchaeota archaeon]